MPVSCFVGFGDCLYPKNVKTVRPILPKICVTTHMTHGRFSCVRN